MTPMPPIHDLLANEPLRNTEFPVTRESVFLGHAGVTALPRRVADAVVDYTRASSENQQEFGDVLQRIDDSRADAASLIGSDPGEVALLGPTSLGLSLFANGIDWRNGDEVVCYAEDYPANVYPWMNLEKRGVRVRFLEPERPGEITPDLVADAMTANTRLVALASCHFLTGHRIEVDRIGRLVRDRGALFSLDAIQTLGAFETRVDHVDFLSADSHKWLLGPLTAGIVFVRKSRFDELHPTLIGAWNVRSPHFITQNQVEFEPGARRYEPGVLNAAGIFGMQAAIRMLTGYGIDSVSHRILSLKSRLIEGLGALGCSFLGPVDGPHASGITTFQHPRVPTHTLMAELTRHRITASHRHDRSGNEYIRLSPHFYNTGEEMDRVIHAVRQAVG